MDKSSSHKTDGTPSLLNVKEKRATAGGIKVEVTFKDLFEIALEKACKEKGLTKKQFIEETLERALMKGGYLPDWWLNRQF